MDTSVVDFAVFRAQRTKNSTRVAQSREALVIRTVPNLLQNSVIFQQVGRVSADKPRSPHGANHKQQPPNNLRRGADDIQDLKSIPLHAGLTHEYQRDVAADEVGEEDDSPRPQSLFLVVCA